MRLLVQIVLAVVLTDVVLCAPTEVSEAPHAAEVEFAIKRGQLIFETDKISARATDAILATIDREKETRVQGWVTLPRDGGMLVRFVGADGEIYYSYYDVWVPTEGRARVQRLDPPEVLGSSQRGRFVARNTAMQAMPFQCSDRYNTVVFPSEDGDGWTVYLLAATTEPGVILVGGHFRATMSKDGASVQSMEPLANTCLTTTPPEKEDNFDVEGAFVTHVLSPTPIETHVFLSLLHGLPMYVGTDAGVWFVSDGSIRFVEPWSDDDEDGG